MRWYDDPILILGMGLLVLCLILALTAGLCLILLWFSRQRLRYAYDRLPINWGEPLIEERSREDVVAEASVLELAGDLLVALAERDFLRKALEASEERFSHADRARRRHLATVRRLQRERDQVPDLVPEVWSRDLVSRRGS